MFDSLTVGSFLVCCLLLCGLKAEIYECPDEWITFEVKCYRFVFYPEMTHDDARANCGANGASLVGINSLREHEFVSRWLMGNDLSRREFFTSGLIRNLAEGDMVWESDGSHISHDLQFWLSEEDKLDAGQFITYKYGVTTYGWSRAPSVSLLPFICEISQEEAYRITEDNRDFDYGTEVSDPNEVVRGPKFTKEPTSILLFRDIAQVVIDCAVFSIPSPTFRMYRTLRSTGQTILITVDTDLRYSLTNGRLTIFNPIEVLDAGQYFCEATNPLGTVVSRSGVLSFGDLAEFSNVQREKVRVKKHSSGIIDCIPPNYRPAVAFGWMKYRLGNFIRPELMPHLFVSYNGKLYFSEVGSSDAGEYFCMVRLKPLRGTAYGTDQPPSKVSLPIELEVTDSLPMDWGPEISNDFIAVFPREPLRGHRVRMECLAFGTMPIEYSWRREKLPMPPNVTLSQSNRVLEIPDVQLEDSGTYTCRASRRSGSPGSTFQEKSFNLNVQSSPFFIFELKDKHVDEGRRLTWRCQARAQPAPTYTWLKNGQVLSNDIGNVEVASNVLTIVAPDASKHDGMYQCMATNTHGTVYSSGQLRVLGFQPTFKKNPVQSTTLSAQGGTATIICNPEAAPTPTFTWTKNGSPVGSPDVGARIRVLQNGNILISQLVMADEGSYTCNVENSYGAASSTGYLRVLGRTTISNPPMSSPVTVNSTAFLACQASHDPKLDLETTWYFQGRPLNWADGHYIMGTAGGISGLYIQGAQTKHSGQYACRAKTTFDTVMVNATLSVRGPPGEQAGVMVFAREGMGESTIYLQWTTGANWGSPVTHFTVQISTNFNDSWVVWREDIPVSETVVDGRERREAKIEGLKPWTVYRFRIKARNAFGYGPYSLPSGTYQTSAAIPVTPPSNVTSGAGKVGNLFIIWAPVLPEDRGGPGFGYYVYHRLHSRPGDSWIKTKLGDVTRYIHLVGPDFFYTQYDVKVQPYNAVGPGPNSTVFTIYSAEELPLGTPSNVIINRFNATALTATWVPVEDTREIVRGKILGYQINYWEDVPNPKMMQHFTGENTDHATVIGLLANTWYYMDVQVYNRAGLGPRSEYYRQRTWMSEIKSQPTEVMVTSHGRDSVSVTWRGVGSEPYEETLIGYVMRYWPATDNIRTAKVQFTGHHSYGVIRGVQKNVLYKLRIFSYSRGGDGASSPDHLFTLGGQIRFDSTTTEVLAGAARPVWHVVLVSACLIVWMLL